MIKDPIELASHIQQLIFEKLYFESEEISDEQVLIMSLLIIKTMIEIETKPKRLGRFLSTQNELKLRLRTLKDS
jgi:hypothetical protein